MSKQIILHIGYPKTGTTTLQKKFFPFLENTFYLGKHYNSLDLFNKGIENIRNDIVFKTKSDFIANKEKYLKKLVAYNNKRIILSDEIFARKHYSIILERLKKLFSEAFPDSKISVLVVIRKQEEIILSQFVEKFSFGKNIKNYIEHGLNSPYEGPFYSIYDYYEVISFMKTLFGENNVNVLLFEEFRDNPELFYAQISKIFSCDISFTQKCLKAHENKKVNINGEYSKRSSLEEKIKIFKYNYLPHFKTPDFLKWMVKKIKFDSTHRFSLTKDQIRIIRDYYSTSNRMLEDEIGVDLSRYDYYD